MDLAGIWASVSFPSQITGFCGAVYSGCSDPELGKACVRAWNDWFAEEWREPYAERFVGLGIVYLADADEAAAEIRRNAARGFTGGVAARAAPPARATRRCTRAGGTRCSPRAPRPARSPACTSAAAG